MSECALIICVIYIVERNRPGKNRSSFNLVAFFFFAPVSLKLWNLLLSGGLLGTFHVEVTQVVERTQCYLIDEFAWCRKAKLVWSCVFGLKQLVYNINVCLFVIMSHIYLYLSIYIYVQLRLLFIAGSQSATLPAYAQWVLLQIWNQYCPRTYIYIRIHSSVISRSNHFGTFSSYAQLAPLPLKHWRTLRFYRKTCTALLRHV